MKVDGTRFRRRRFALFAERLQATGARRILDVGGTHSFWQALRPQWQQFDLDITIVNLQPRKDDSPPYRFRQGNACDLGEFADNSFDIVHSNSVIEHVGNWSAMVAMAGEVRRLAPHYFVQTPNYWFPLEPHFRAVFFNLLPPTRRARRLMRNGGPFHPPYTDYGEAMRVVEGVNLLDAGGLRELFPDGRLVRERFAGLVKSLVIVR